MSAGTVVIGSDERSTRALLTVVPRPEEAQVVQLGPLERSAALTLPVASVTHYPDVDAHAFPAPDLADLVESHRPPTGIVVLDSSQWCRDVAGYLSRRLDAAVVWAIDRVAGGDGAYLADHLVLGGSHRLVHRVPLDDGITVVLAKPVGALAGRAAQPPSFAEKPTPSPRADVRELSHTPHEQRGAALPQAKVVVCIGRGIGGAENVGLFQRLADELGGALGATRAVVDRGWLPFAHQVGQTGETVAPELYLGFGVSGAPQHLAGMRESKRVVAINTDVDAPLCRLADAVIEGGAVEVAERLLAGIAEGVESRA